MKIIDRDMYLNTMIRVISTPDIKIITGVRSTELLNSKLIFRMKKVMELRIV